MKIVPTKAVRMIAHQWWGLQFSRQSWSLRSSMIAVLYWCLMTKIPQALQSLDRLTSRDFLVHGYSLLKRHPKTPCYWDSIISVRSKHVSHATNSFPFTDWINTWFGLPRPMASWRIQSVENSFEIAARTDELNDSLLLRVLGSGSWYFILVSWSSAEFMILQGVPVSVPAAGLETEADFLKEEPWLSMAE